MGDRLPALLTVEEAGGVLRVGRTKAYAMAREWRDSGGRSGLPVIDLGHVLRVPRRALEDLIGASLDDVPAPDASAHGSDPSEEPMPAPVGTASPTPRRPFRHRHDDASGQPNLFDSPTAS
ncbi:MAG: helix-turn-helix domain-containing protein [Acidimicrobiales bacterium]